MSGTNALSIMLAVLLVAVITPTGQPLPKQPSDYTPAAPSSMVSWQMKRLAPPSLLYVGVDDALRATAASSQTSEVVTIGYRLLRAEDGKIVPGSFNVAPANTRAVATKTQQLAEGFLLSVSCQASTATTRGQTFVRVALAPVSLGASVAAQQLMADYVTTQQAPAYPNGRVLAPTEGPGFVYTVTATPAVSTDFIFTVPNNARWKLLSMYAQLATVVAGGATRFPQFRIGGGANRKYLCMASQTVGDNATVAIAGGTVLPASVANSGVLNWAWPIDQVLDPGEVFASTTVGLQVGDQYSQVSVMVQEWLDNV